mgnify:CR=1 FL=1
MVPVSKITTIIEQAAQTTGHTQDEVASVMSHCFKIIRQQLEYPTYAGIRIPYIGAIRTKSSILAHYLRVNAIPYLRIGKISKERFQHLWRLRKLTRDDEQRRDFKTRYGLEFKPAWRSDTDSVGEDGGSYSNRSGTLDSCE